MSLRPPRLGVNIDHVATVRNARGGILPDPVRAALVAIEAGADGITAHLREDRRHIRDKDMERLKVEISKPLNFEMAATDEMLAIALRVKPHAVCLVPEKREERTTEGGLDVVAGENHLRPYVAKLNDAGIRVSLFIAADAASIDAAHRLKAPVVEFHSGSWCDAIAEGQKQHADAEFARLVAGVKQASALGIEPHVGHGLDYATAEIVSALPQVAELNIGHFLVGEAIFIGLPQAIRTMKLAMANGRARSQ